MSMQKPRLTKKKSAHSVKTKECDKNHKETGRRVQVRKREPAHRETERPQVGNSKRQLTLI